MASSDRTGSDDSVGKPSTDGVSWSMVATAGLGAILIGGVAAWATLKLGIAWIAFVVMAVASGYWMYRKPIPSAAIGFGAYLLALELILTPILFYVPVVLSSSEEEGVEAAGTFIGSLLGLVIWGFVFLLVAVVVAAVGWFAGRRAERKLDDRTAG